MMENISVFVREKVVKTLRDGVHKVPDALNGFLSGLWLDGNLHVLGFRISENPSHKRFEHEFDKATNYLPAGIKLCGLFLKTSQPDVLLILKNVFKSILPSTSVLRDCFEFDRILILALDESSSRSHLYWYSFKEQEMWQAEMKIIDGENLKNLFISFRIKGSLTLAFEHQDNAVACVYSIQSEVQHLKDVVGGAQMVFAVSDGCRLRLLYNRLSSKEWPRTSDEYVDWPAKRLLQSLAAEESKKCQTQSSVSVSFLFQSTGSIASDNCISCVPVIHHDHKKFRYVVVKLPIDVLAVTSWDLQLNCLPAVFVEGIWRQLDSLTECLISHYKDGSYLTPKPFHFLPSPLDHSITIVYPEGTEDNKLEHVRAGLHKQFLLPLTRPIFRRSNSLTLSKETTSDGRLLDVHIGLGPSGVTNGRCYTVRGHYAYYHYMQDRLDDNGWGCAYRSLQTLASWLRLQGYTEKEVPSHTEIQQCLVTIGDKETSFLGSKKWIGSVEVGYVLDHLFGISCKTLFVSSGSELATKARELANHFETQEIPVMIGGGVLAHTILGVDWNEGTGEVKFLILDPHFTGGENLKVIQEKGWCGWKSVDFWDKTAYYNMCMPQRPTAF